MGGVRVFHCCLSFCQEVLGLLLLGESRSHQVHKASSGQQHPLPEVEPNGELAEARVMHRGLMTLAQYLHLGWVNLNLTSNQTRSQQGGWPNGNGTEATLSQFYMKNCSYPFGGPHLSLQGPK